MAAPSALERRAARRARNGSMVDMNLVSLIDVFTILIFFLLSSATGVETLVSPRAVRLPLADAQQAPRETVVVVVTDQEVLAEGRSVARVADALADAGDRIPALETELALLARRKALRSDHAAGAAQALTILGDRAIPYRLLRKVMSSCAAAGYTDVSFAVRRRGEA
ncbi:MAG: biopolymer transporter ExbD [Burkholderiales bacterium]|nr:biopolymer transporter ExbD [Burkholderiales bacterium]